MIYFLIPIYNEADNIEVLSQNLLGLNLNSPITFVFSDDASKDNSLDLLSSYFSATDFKIITTPTNGGPGQAFNNGFLWILSQSTSDNDLIITLEADSTGDYGLIEQMIALNKFGYELILASVYAQGGRFEKTAFFRKFISFFANMLFRAAFNVKTLTLSSFYRCYDIRLVKRLHSKYGDKIIEENGFICMLEILLKSIDNGAKVIELPMTLNSTNRVGKSKMKILSTTGQYLKFLVKYKFRK